MSIECNHNIHLIAAHTVTWLNERCRIVNSLTITTIKCQIAQDACPKEVCRYPLSELLFIKVASKHPGCTMIDVEVDDIVVIDIVHLYAIISPRRRSDYGRQRDDGSASR